MKTKLIILILLVTNIFNSYSQNKSITINGGMWSGNKFFEGYYFSSNFRIPLSNIFEISPSITFGSNFSKDNRILLTQDEIYLYNQENLSELYINESFNSFDILFLIKPIYFFNKSNIKHDLIIGTGVGYKSYSLNKTGYNISNQLNEFKKISFKSFHGFEPYYFKINYNYIYSSNLFFGIDISANSFDGEGIIFYGLNFGFKL